jgi:predicted nucleotidyltransferase
LKKIKPEGRFSHYTAGQKNPVYYSHKRLYAMQQLYTSGLIQKLLSMESAKTIVIFGSMIKGDWYKDSDIDIFILGKSPDFDRKAYESRLGRDIELHVFHGERDMKDVKTGLLKNVMNGYLIKGSMQDIAAIV